MSVQRIFKNKVAGHVLVLVLAELVCLLGAWVLIDRHSASGSSRTVLVRPNFVAQTTAVAITPTTLPTGIAVAGDHLEMPADSAVQSEVQTIEVAQPSATSSPTAQPTQTVQVLPTERQTVSTATSTAQGTAPPQPTATSTALSIPQSTAPPRPTATRPPPPPRVIKPSGTPILPTGAKYGDHNPNVPGRVVRITAPSIKLDTKVYEVYVIGNNWEVAQYAAGHQFNSANPGDGGNIVINGHNNWKGEVFRYLEFLKPGDEIHLFTQAGKEYVYRVRQILKLKEAGVSYQQRLQNGKVMDPTPQEQLTLITCWPYTTFTHRLIVIADPVPAGT